MADPRELLAQQVAKLDMDRSLANKSGMSDQAIRAHALECASRCFGDGNFVTEKDVLATAIDFEAYIRDGVT